MKHERRIYLAPAHPCMGWVSMNRYWQALRSESSGDKDVRSVLQAGLVEAPAKSKWKRLWIRRIGYPLLVRSHVRAGVMHVLDHSFADLLAHVPPSVRRVVTVHDLIPLTDPADLTPRQRDRYRKTVNWITQADRVVCVSEHTCREVQRLLKIPDEKLRVLPNGTSLLPPPDAVISQRLSALTPYIFSVGGVRPRKNLKLLIPLAKHLAEKGQRATFVRAGAWLDEDLAGQCRVYADLHELGPVNDAALSAAYTQAALTLVPSLHEGFGLPVLEAMQAGCPVVYSLTTSLPEVAGDAGLSFDPEDVAEVASQCLRVLSDPGLRSRMIALGHQRAASFTWKAHWQGLSEIYDGLLSS